MEDQSDGDKEVQKRGDSKNRGCKPYSPSLPAYDMSMDKYHLIFNHIIYRDKDIPERDPGTTRDCKRLARLFKTFGFRVFVYKNYRKEEIFKLLRDFCKKNHNNTSCVAVTFLTHGYDGDILWAYDTHYYLHDIIKIFENADINLFHKPKLFFIQACRGKAHDYGRIVRPGKSQGEVQPSTSNDLKQEIDYSVRPKEAHYLVVHASAPGHVSCNGPFIECNGSWLIQSLCDVLEIFYEELDLLKSLYIVNKLVASKCSNNQEAPLHNGTKQTPMDNFTLTKKVTFTNYEVMYDIVYDSAP